jgi:hypothetical protein
MTEQCADPTLTFFMVWALLVPLGIVVWMAVLYLVGMVVNAILMAVTGNDVKDLWQDMQYKRESAKSSRQQP